VCKFTWSDEDCRRECRGLQATDSARGCRLTSVGYSGLQRVAARLEDLLDGSGLLQHREKPLLHRDDDALLQWSCSAEQGSGAECRGAGEACRGGVRKVTARTPEGWQCNERAEVCAEWRAQRGVRTVVQMPMAVVPILMASMAYSTWKRRPSGEKVFTPRSYSLRVRNI